MFCCAFWVYFGPLQIVQPYLDILAKAHGGAQSAGGGGAFRSHQHWHAAGVGPQLACHSRVSYALRVRTLVFLVYYFDGVRVGRCSM